MITIVYPYLEKYARWEELRYSLRSLEKHLKGDYRVLLVGDKPSWATNVEHIAVERDPRKGQTNHYDVANKMLVAAEHIGSGSMIRMYDDVYFLKDVKVEEVGLMNGKHVATEKLTFKDWQKKGWKRYMLESNMKQHRMLLFKSYLKLYNDPEFKGSVYNFETHSPKLFDVEQFLRAQSRWMFKENRLLINTLYYNFFVNEEPVVIPKREGFMVIAHGVNSGLSDVFTEENAENLLSGNTYLNHNNRGLNEVLTEAIKIRFPEKSSFEM